MNARQATSPGTIANGWRLFSFRAMAPFLVVLGGSTILWCVRTGYADEPLHRSDAPENQENDNDEENQT
jgi:hypothetical protein